MEILSQQLFVIAFLRSCQRFQVIFMLQAVVVLIGNNIPQFEERTSNKLAVPALAGQTEALFKIAGCLVKIAQPFCYLTKLAQYPGSLVCISVYIGDIVGNDGRILETANGYQLLDGLGRVNGFSFNIACLPPMLDQGKRLVLVVRIDGFYCLSDLAVKGRPHIFRDSV